MSMTPPPPPPPPSNPPPPPGGDSGQPFGAGGWQPQPVGPKPPNYLVWAILTTLFCCLPFGVVSIVYAAQVDGNYNRGDYAGAVASSENAKKWAKISAIVGVVVVVLYILFLVAVVGSTTISG